MPPKFKQDSMDDGRLDLFVGPLLKPHFEHLMEMLQLKFNESWKNKELSYKIVVDSGGKQKEEI